MLKISRESEINLVNVLIDNDIISGKDLINIKKKCDHFVILDQEMGTETKNYGKLFHCLAQDEMLNQYVYRFL